MESFEKKAYMGQLFDLYGDLLTEKQIAYFKLYYFEDYSLQEISEVFEVSRNAVFDHIKKAEDHLEEYEHVLKLHAKREKRQELYDKLEKDYDPKLVDELRKLDE